MVFYAVAVAATLLLSHYCSTVYVLPGEIRVRGFRNAFVAFLAILPLTFVAVTRWNVGWDSAYESSYWVAYWDSAEGLNSREMEVGFFWLMRFFSEQEVPYFWFLFAHGILFAAAVSIALSRGSLWPIWSVLLYFALFFYFDSYSSLRQSLAEAVCLIGWAEMLYLPPSGRKDWKILLLFGAGSLFHLTALMNILIYIVSKFRFSRSSLMKIGVFAIVLTPVFQVVLPILMRFLAPDGYAPIGFARINALLSGALFLLCWYFYDDISALDENAYTFVNMSLWIFIIFMNSNVLYLPFRIFDMAKIGYVFIVPVLLRSIRDSKIRIYIQYGLLAMFGAWFYNSFFIQDTIFAHYQSALDDWSYITNLP